MSIRIVAIAPTVHVGMAWDQEGAEVIHEMLTSMGQSVEIVKHKDTYYVVKK